MNDFNIILKILRKYSPLFNLLIDPVTYDPEEEQVYEKRFLLYGEKYESYDQSVFTSCSMCVNTGKVLSELFTQYKDIFNMNSITPNINLLNGVDLYHDINYRSLDFSARKMHIFKELCIEWFMLYKFVLINMETRAAGSHVFTMIYHNTSVYVIQSYYNRYNIIIDVYDNITDVFDLLTDNVDNDQHEDNIAHFFHIEDNKNLPLSNNSISLHFTQLLIPNKQKLLKFLRDHKKQLSSDPIWIDTYNNAIKDIINL